MTIVEDTRDAERFVGWADELGAAIAPHSARHDREGTFVTEAFDLLRSSGYLALPVPRELGGHGATVAEVTLAQASLARHCGATALASAMHLHVVASAAHRWRHGEASMEAMLAQVADERLVVVSTGGTDGARPSGTATAMEGGWIVSGRKVFCSQTPIGDVVSTWFPADGPDGPFILGMGIPLSAPGVEVVETWDTLGMRGTGSHDLVFTDVFVSDDQITARRPYGELDPQLCLSYLNAMTIVAGVYWGLAQQAGEVALESKQRSASSGGGSAAACRTAGSIEAKLTTLRWTMRGLLEDLGPDPHGTVANLMTVMLAKRTVAEDGLAVADLAMELVGGSSYFRAKPLEQLWRDLRAAKYHPWPPEATLHQVGRFRLGLPVDEVLTLRSGARPGRRRPGRSARRPRPSRSAPTRSSARRRAPGSRWRPPGRP